MNLVELNNALNTLPAGDAIWEDVAILTNDGERHTSFEIDRLQLIQELGVKDGKRQIFKRVAIICKSKD